MSETQNPDTSAASQKWFPYSSKTMFLLDTLDNLPRHRISSSLMRVFLWILQEAGCKDVLSFDHLRQVQKKIRGQCGIPSIPCKSAQGNVFFMNDPRAIIANVSDVKINITDSEADRILGLDKSHDSFGTRKKWRKNMDLDMLSPMYAAGLSHYYVNEVARLRDGRFIVPMRWVTHKNKVWTDTFSVTFNEQGEATIMDERTVFICAEDLQDNYYDLEQASQLPKWGASTIESGYPTHMPNPKRIIAAGRPFYSSFVDYFSDDVSGNRSKSWNKHWNVYATHRNLPRHLLQQEFHVHFISTSPNATVSEQFCEFKQAVEETHTNPIEVQDDSGDAGPSDNPMQSEISAHIGGKGNCLCRKCRVGGTQKEKATDEHGTEEASVIKHVKDLQTETGVKDAYTQFTIDELLSRFKEMRKAEPTRPIEEIEAETNTMDGRQRRQDIYQPTQTGLLIHAICANYIMQYAGSLIGRQFKTIAQTNLFHVRDLVTDDQFKAWRATGKLAALLWFPEIRNLNEYQVFFLSCGVANVLDIFGTIDPSKIISKVKYHLLVHAGEDVAEFEVFKSFNTVFRHCSVLSNHLAPSRDIARQLADQEGLKHRLTGGWWSSSRDEMTQRAGQKESVTHLLHTTTAARAVNYGLYSPESTWTKCKWVISESLEECFVGSWVFAQSLTAQINQDLDSAIPGHISDILVDNGGTVLVVLEVFQVLSLRDETYGLCQSWYADTLK
ncbi:hypothetical protein B0H14DRAFT_3091910 [Mycena olivaceomarginata]|nr:hypothetical protein B0H14DRAFT_3091910 [Mycena olivaceomarginata]